MERANPARNAYICAGFPIRQGEVRAPERASIQAARIRARGIFVFYRELRSCAQRTNIMCKNAALSDAPSPILMRDGAYMGGPRVMVSLGVSWRGVGALRFSPQGTTTCAETYLEILRNTYLVDFVRIFGASPYFVWRLASAFPILFFYARIIFRPIAQQSVYFSTRRGVLSPRY